MGKSINKIVKYLEENMTVYKEGNESKKKRVHKKESMETTKSRWNVSNDEVVWTSSLIYIGNLPFAMTFNVANGKDVETKTIIIFVWICLNAKVTLINGLK